MRNAATILNEDSEEHLVGQVAEFSIASQPVRVVAASSLYLV